MATPRRRHRQAEGRQRLFVFAVCLMLFRLLFRGLHAALRATEKLLPRPRHRQRPSFVLLTITHYV